MELLLILKKIESRNYIWIYKNTNDFCIKIGHRNNTLIDSVNVDYERLHNTIYSLVKVLKTHKYYYVNVQLLSDVKLDNYSIKIITN